MTALPNLQIGDSRRPSLHPVRHEDLATLYKREPHHVFFRMQTPAGDIGNNDPVRDHLGITTVELAKCLPWIPGNSIIVLCCSEGFSPLLRLELSSLHTDRELFLVDNDAPSLGIFHEQADRVVP
jgi:hypothetical protein